MADYYINKQITITKPIKGLEVGKSYTICKPPKGKTNGSIKVYVSVEDAKIEVIFWKCEPALFLLAEIQETIPEIKRSKRTLIIQKSKRTPIIQKSKRTR